MARRIRARRSAVAIVVAAGVVVSGAGVVPAAQASAGPNVHTTRVIKHFASCEAAGNWLNGADHSGQARYLFTNRFKAPTVVDTGGNFWEAKTHATTTYQPKQSSIELIVPAWPRMTEANRTAVREYASALFVHEEGHERLAQDILAHYSNYPLLGAGEGRDAALSDLRTEEGKYWAEIQRYVKEREDAYDQLTDHGRKQSRATGDLAGKDVVLKCD